MANYSSYMPTPTSPFTSVRLITPSDTNDLAAMGCKGLVVTAAGNIVWRGVGDITDQTISGVPAYSKAFSEAMIRFVKVGTTATVWGLF